MADKTEAQKLFDALVKGEKIAVPAPSAKGDDAPSAKGASAPAPKDPARDEA